VLVKLEIQKRVSILSSKGNDKRDLRETVKRPAKILLKDNQSDVDEMKQSPKWLEVAVMSPTHSVH